jgi:quinol-cytochrome oxidoreductase complex cytochrome b subunit
MKPKATYFYVHFGVLVLIPVYLFIVISYLFFAPNFLGRENSALNSSLNKNTKTFYFLIRDNRSNDITKTIAKSKQGFITSLIINADPLLTAAPSPVHLSLFPLNHHYSYLSNHILRI